MTFTIKRGTKEIGGSCVEVATSTTRILIDFGLPLVGVSGKDFRFDGFKALDQEELIQKGILPDINGAYPGQNGIGAVLISHPHADHFGLLPYINSQIPVWLGEATHEIIKLNNLFLRQNIEIQHPHYFKGELPFRIGDITITPWRMDHSAFDSYAFLIEGEGRSLFYSGDFRAHGRLEGVFRRFVHIAPQSPDYLLLEGTTIGRESKKPNTEKDIEDQMAEVFKQKGKSNLVYASGQNIDRLVSIYKACNKAKKIWVVDVYVASVLKLLSKYAALPQPSSRFKNVRVLFGRRTSDHMTAIGREDILYALRYYKITKEEIAQQKENIVLLVRPSMQTDLEHMPGIDGGNLIYSMWEGYLQKTDTKKFIDYLTGRKFNMYKIHTSGHADIETLKKMVDAIKPKAIVPIHTFSGSEYKKIFSVPVVELKDGEQVQIN